MANRQLPQYEFGFAAAGPAASAGFRGCSGSSGEKGKLLDDTRIGHRCCLAGLGGEFKIAKLVKPKTPLVQMTWEVKDKRGNMVGLVKM